MADSDKRAWRELRELTEILNGDDNSVLEEDDTLDAALRRQEHDIVSASGQTAAMPGPRRELKSARHFRAGLTKIAADRVVDESLRDAHPDSGPLNPEKLITHSLATMRDLSPRFLGRFVAYVDTLFYLEQSRD